MKRFAAPDAAIDDLWQEANLISEMQRPTSASPPADTAGGAVSTGPPRLTPLRELQLLEQHRAGDPKALSELLTSYQRRVYSICCRMVHDPERSRDLTQDVLLKVMNGLDGYDGRAKLSTWIIRITINTCLSDLQKQKVRQTASLDDLSTGSSSSDRSVELPASMGGQRELSGAEVVELGERRVAVERALGGLDADARAILVLRDVQDLEYQQISEVLEVPVGTVKSRLFRARASFRTALEQEMARLSGTAGDEMGTKTA